MPVILITGGSRGIGAATALLAAQQGYSVCISYNNNHDAAQHVVYEIESRGGTAALIRSDIGIEANVINLFEFCIQKFGRIDVLVNNAGILESQMRLDEMSAARMQRIFNINAIGTLLCCREAVKHMSTRHGGQGGVIVNVSSAASRLGSPNEYIDYAASKGAIDTLTIGLAKEVAHENIRINGVRPGLILTDMHASGGDPGRVDRLKSTVPMQRGGNAEEVAQAIMWLASDKASYVTGTLVDVSGGR
jgi:NAD(P)-dependent dehydrogenase (short-subunit alcohol dehydrogenase family)